MNVLFFRTLHAASLHSSYLSTLNAHPLTAHRSPLNSHRSPFTSQSADSPSGSATSLPNGIL